MTERLHDQKPDPRSPADRARDHAALERLTDALLPSLVAKLGASGLGELEVREGTWRVRLRRPLAPSGSGVAVRRASGDRAGRVQPGHEGHGHAPAALEGRRTARMPGTHSTNGSVPGEPIAAERGPHDRAASGDDPRTNALSPAVGIFRPGLAPGARVRAGDRVAVVDQLGIPVDVPSPVDGIVGATLVEAGDAVEYGEPVVVVERREGDG